MVEDAVWITEKASCELAVAAYELLLRQSAEGEVGCLLAGLDDLVYDAIANGRRSFCEVVANFPKMALRCWDEDVFGHLAVASPVLEEGLGHFLRDEFAAFGLGHTLL